MDKRVVLVTGGAGYIGSHTVVELYEAGYQPVIVDNLSNSTIEMVRGAEKITGESLPFHNIDCTDYRLLKEVIESYPTLSYAIHFAAYKAVGESVEKPLLYYRNNLLSLLNLVELLEVRSGSIVFSSSCTVYGQPSPENLPVSESAPLQEAHSPYGKSKQMGEDILLDSVKMPGSRLNAISLRYFNPVGAHPSAHIGELPLSVPQNLLPYVTQTAAGIRGELKVFGDDYNTPDGTAIRDYIYVTDLAKAHVAAIGWLEKMEHQRGEIEYFNLGTGKGLSVLEVVTAFQEATGVKVPYQIVGRRAGDIEQVWADPTKANRELNWSADTPLDEVMRSAWRWEERVRKEREPL